MDRYQFEDLISAYIENELSLSKRKEVGLYLAENPHEDQLVKQISLNINALKNLPKISAKENFNKKLLERIKSEKLYVAPELKTEKTLFGFSIFNVSLLITLFAIFLILSLEITDSIPSLQNSQSNIVTEDKNLMDKKKISKKFKAEDDINTNFTELKNDTTKKEKRDFSKNIKYVND